MFLKNGTTYVNLDQVGKAAPGHRMGGRDVSTGFYAANGNPIDTTGALPDLERLTAPLVPSNAVVIAVTAAGQTTAHPLAAFRVLRDGTAEPVFAVAPPKGAALFQMVGGQTLVGLNDGQLFADLAVARSAVTGAPTPEPVEPEQPRVTAGGRRHGTGTR
jgi:hypothetical protein